MESKESKQFLLLHSTPIFLHTLQIFESHPRVDEIVLAIREEEREKVLYWIDQAKLTKVTQLVTGGKERQESVYNGLRVLHTEYVLVHDAVRPFVTHQQIDELIEALATWKAAVLGVPVKDTIKLVNDQGIVEATPERRKLWAVQTPQAFRRELLLRAHEYAIEKQIVATDDAMLIEKLGIPVKMVPGDYTNIKITTPEDLILAETIYAIRSKQDDSNWTRV